MSNQVLSKLGYGLLLVASVFILQFCTQPESEPKSPRVLSFNLNDSLERYDSLSLILADEFGKPIDTIFSGRVTQETSIKKYTLPSGLNRFQIIRTGWKSDGIDVKTLIYSGTELTEEVFTSQSLVPGKDPLNTGNKPGVKLDSIRVGKFVEGLIGRIEFWGRSESKSSRIEVVKKPEAADFEFTEKQGSFSAVLEWKPNETDIGEHALVFRILDSVAAMDTVLKVTVSGAYSLNLSSQGDGEVRPSGKHKAIGPLGVRAIAGPGAFFQKWLIVSGKPEIDDVFQDSTRITLREGDVQVVAVFNATPPPKVHFTSPTAGLKFQKDIPIEVKVNVNDSGGKISRMVLTWRNLTYGKEAEIPMEKPPFERSLDSLLGGSYALIVSALGENGAEGRDSLNFSIHSPPMVKMQSTHVSVAAGDSARFQSQLAEGAYPEPVYQWKRENKTLPESGAELLFPSVAYGDEGTYSLLVSNEAGSMELKDLTLEVKDVIPPKLALVGAVDTVIAINSFFAEPGVKATDDKDGEITDRIRVSGAVNPQKIGKYSLTYTVEDMAKNSTSMVRTVIVAGWALVDSTKICCSTYMAGIAANEDGDLFLAYLDRLNTVHLLKKPAVGDWVELAAMKVSEDVRSVRIKVSPLDRLPRIASLAWSSGIKSYKWNGHQLEQTHDFSTYVPDNTEAFDFAISPVTGFPVFLFSKDWSARWYTSEKIDSPLFEPQGFIADYAGDDVFSISMSRQGIPYITFNLGDNKVVVYKYVGESWEQVGPVVADYSQYPSNGKRKQIKLDADGRPIIAIFPEGKAPTVFRLASQWWANLSGIEDEKLQSCKGGALTVDAGNSPVIACIQESQGAYNGIVVKQYRKDKWISMPETDPSVLWLGHSLNFHKLALEVSPEGDLYLAAAEGNGSTDRIYVWKYHDPSTLK